MSHEAGVRGTVSAGSTVVAAARHGPAPPTEAADALWPPDGSTAEWLDAAADSAAEHIALDEVLLDAAHEGETPRPVVRCWELSRPAVVVGSSSRVTDEVDHDACTRAGVEIVRRPSGGLTVVLGPGCLAWTVVIPCPGGPPPVERIHRGILQPLAAALGIRLGDGRRVERLGTCDLALLDGSGPRKVGGNALRIRSRAILYHGTLLHGLDLDLVARLLKHPPREPDYRARRDHRSFLTQLPLDRAALERAVREAFPCATTRHDWPADRVSRLVATRYGATEWTHRH